MEILTKNEKENLANSPEMLSLYRTLANVHAVAVNHIKKKIDDGLSAAAIEGEATRMTGHLESVVSSLMDRDNVCGPKQHWDESVGGCVPNIGGSLS